MKDMILKTTNSFIWGEKDKRHRSRWEIMTRAPERGSSGVKYPVSIIYATKISMLVKLTSIGRQPWMRRIE